MIKAKEIFILCAILFFLSSGAIIKDICFAQTSASQMERTQEMMLKDEMLRDKIAGREKSFIKKIIVQGITLLGEDEIKRIILPFQKRWLAEEDIQELVDLLKEAYRQASQVVPQISYEVEGSKLLIEVKEEKR